MGKLLPHLYSLFVYSVSQLFRALVEACLQIKGRLFYSGVLILPISSLGMPTHDRSEILSS